MTTKTFADIPKGKKIDEQVPLAKLELTYDPNRLLDALIEKFHLSNDAELCRLLEISPAIISKIRHRRIPVSAPLLIVIHEASGISIKELRALMGHYGEKFRIDDKALKPIKISAPIDVGEKLDDLVTYGANQLIDAVINKLRLKNVVALRRLMGISPSEISNIRRGHRKVGATLLVRLHEASGISIEELGTLIGNFGEKFRVGDNTSQANKY